MQFINYKHIAVVGIVALVAACGGGTSNEGVLATPQVYVEPTLSTSPFNLNGSLSLGLDNWVDGSSSLGGRGSTIGGVTCLITEDYHVHAHLSIIRNGQLLAIPPHIGLTGCAYELHTHDKSGIIHVETAAYHRLTLGQFFAVWGQTLSSNNVAGIVGMPMNVFINDGGNLTHYKGDVAEIELTKYREITIVLGDNIKQIPSFKWDPTL